MKTIETQKQNPLLASFMRYVSFSVLGMIGLSCYILADTYFIALGMGSDGLAALNLALPIYSFMNGLTLMAGVGSATRYSIFMGQNQQKKANQIFTHGFIFALLLAAVFFILGLFFVNPLASLLGAEGVVHTMSVDYMRMFLLFAPFFFLNNLMNAFVRNDGSPNLAMAAMLIGSLTNIVLDYVFVFPLQMGMAGAALATGMAPVVGLLILSTHILRKKNTFRFVKIKLSLKKLKDISALGVSSLITEVAVGLVIIIFNLIILDISGTVGVAAYGVVVNLGLVMVSVFTGVAQGSQPLLSRNYGKGKFARLFKLYKYGLVFAVSAAVLVYLAVSFFAEPITMLFNTQNNQELTPLAVEGIKIYFSAFIFAAVNIVTSSFFSAVEQPGKSFMLSLSRGLFLVIPLAFLLSRLFGMTGVWMTQPITEILTVIISIVFICLYKKRLSHIAKEQETLKTV